ncbi:flagellar biosynthetic protein FliO [Aromatoleum toluclasticum]|uniref:flagellar biosynthetic protein FliO n=1 Tax=Aromatoleum toluclasticum TaxID=92003 RepID=UPI001D183379|nr:flagellar biosynthetic protein FliO [Aromatoleum toluclasticum]MCC4115916.1 flagellar biosynthetic protein FliO [Aromatoleum toluclasticum]
MAVRLAPLALAGVAAPLFAADAAVPAAPGITDGLGQMLLGLAVVLGLLLGCLWLIKKLSAPHGAAAGLRVLGAVPVGPRERVVLVEVGGQVLVLGVTPTNVRTLHTLPADALQNATPNAPLPSGPFGDFQGWLKRSMERRNDAK